MIVTNFNYSTIYDYLIDQGVIIFLMDLGIALIILIMGLWIIRRITKGLSIYFDKRKLDPTVKSFITPIISVILKAALLITIFKQVGIETTSFIALLGSAGLAVGLALQGSLANFAGGVLILMLKPFKVGDFIEAKGFSGTVKDIQLFYTNLTTINGQKVVIPNGDLSNSSVINYSANPTRRLDLTFSIGYDDDINKVKAILLAYISTNKYILTKPEPPQVVLAEYADHAINFKVRGWVNSEHYWDVYWNIMHGVKEEFDKNNITIPYPQMNVHMQSK